MAEDYYKTLGLSRDASVADIQKAHRDLVRKFHPDVNPAPDAKEKFQQIQRAFEVLSDPAKREQYDRYGASFEHMGAGGGPRGGGFQWSGGGEDFDFAQFFGERFGGGQRGAGAGAGTGSFEDLFAQFGAAGAGAGAKRRSGRARRGQDLAHTLEVPFTTAVTGGTVDLRVERPDGSADTLGVRIPPGVLEGQEMRLRGQGEKVQGGSAGDLLLTIQIGSHAYYHRKGVNLYVRTPVTLAEAAAGAKIDVPTPHGTVSVRVPPGSSSGTRLRVRGQGVRPPKAEPGDLFVELSIVLPPELSDAEREQLEAISSAHKQEPRKELRW